MQTIADASYAKRCDMNKLCACGCGLPVSKGKKWVNHHSARDPERRKAQSKLMKELHVDHDMIHKWTPESKAKMVESQKQYWLNHPEEAEIRLQKQSKIMKDKCLNHPNCSSEERKKRWTPERRKKLSQRMKENPPMNNPATRKKVSEKQKLNPSCKLPACQEAIKRSWTPEKRKIQSDKMKKVHKHPNWNGAHARKIIGEKSKKNWEDPAFREKTKRSHDEAYKKPEVKQRMRERSIKLWCDPNFIESQRIGRDMSPNKAEQKLNKILSGLFPEEYKFVGDFQFTMGGKCPDFLNVNGQKKVIELFGNYYHKRGEEAGRIQHFKKYGFDCLIVWENELKEVTTLTEKLINFHGVE